MSVLGLHPVLPWPVAVVLAVLLVSLAVVGLVTRPLRRLQWGLRTGAAVAVAVALLGPGVAGAVAPQASRSIDVWFVVDTTSSSMARDHPGERPRMAGYKEDIPRIADELPGARFALVTFDSSARTAMPLTTDTNALATAVETMRQEITLYSAGSSITVAQDHLRASLERARERRPDRAQVVFYLGDGEQTDGEAPTPFALDGLVDGGAVLGYGTAEGGPMASLSSLGRDDGDIETVDGEPAISQASEDDLRRLADQLGVPYVHRAGGDIAPALADADPGELVEDASQTARTQVSLVWVLATIATALLLGDLWILARDTSRITRATRGEGGS